MGGLAALAGGQRTLHRQASVGAVGPGGALDRAVKHLLGHSPRGGLLQSSNAVARRAQRVALQRLAEQVLLVAEGGIHARPRDTHRLGQVGEGGALIPLAPEDLERALQRLVGVEAAGPAHHRSLCRAHAPKHTQIGIVRYTSAAGCARVISVPSGT